MVDNSSQERPPAPEVPSLPDADAPPGPWRRRLHGYFLVGETDGKVSQVPGSGTAHGEKAIAKAMADVLDTVRRSIRKRSARITASPRI